MFIFLALAGLCGMGLCMRSSGVGQRFGRTLYLEYENQLHLSLLWDFPPHFSVAMSTPDSALVLEASWTQASSLDLSFSAWDLR